MGSRQLWILCAILFGLGLISQPIQYLFPKYMEDTLSQRLWIAGLLRAIPIGLGGISALLAGSLCDRFGRKLTLVLGITGGFLVGFVFISRSAMVILVVLCMQGIASGLKSAGGQSYLIGSVKTSALGRATAAYFLSGIFGQAVGKSAAGVLIKQYSYAAFGFGTVGLGLLLVLVTVLVLPRQQTMIPVTEPETDTDPDSEIETDSRRGFLAALWQNYAPIIGRRNVAILAGIRFFSTFSWGSIQFLMPLLMARLADIQITGFLGGSSDIFACLCLQVAGIICDRTGVIKPAIGSHFLILASLFGLMLSAHSVTGFFVAGILASGAAWSLSTTMPRFIKRFSSDGETGRGVGFLHLAWSLGFLSGYFVASLLIGLGQQIPLICAMVSVSVSAGLIFTLDRGQLEETN